MTHVKLKKLPKLSLRKSSKVAGQPSTSHAQNQAEKEPAVQSACVEQYSKKHLCLGTTHHLVMKSGISIKALYAVVGYYCVSLPVTPQMNVQNNSEVQLLVVVSFPSCLLNF